MSPDGSPGAEGEVPAPPETERRQVVEEVHGHEITDPYRWLEGDDEDVEEWVAAQNEYADRLLDTPTREALRPRMESLAETESHFPVQVAGGTYFQRVEPAGADHPVLQVREDRDADPETLVDPNEWAEGRSMDWYVPSHDGDLVAYGTAEGGTEQYDIVVIDLDGEEVDRVDGVGRSQVAWYDGGFYYLQTGSAGEGDPTGGQLDKRLRRHDLDGTDELLADGFAPDVWPAVDAAEDGRAVVTLSEMSVRSDLYVYAPGDDELTPVIVGEDATFQASVHDDTVYVYTDYDAPRGRVLAAPFEDLTGGEVDPDELRTVVPEGEAVFRGYDLADDLLVAHHHRDAVSELSVYDPETGERLRGIDVPETSRVLGVSANPDERELFYRVEGFDRPPSVRRADPGSGESEFRSGTSVDLVEDLDLSVRQEWFESADGTDLPAFVVHRAGLDPAEDGPLPTVLYGYGGFRNNMTPGFRTYALPFLADGGVYVQAVLRGGSEYGEPWHEAGMREHKTNVFEDFEAVGEGLVDRGYTDTDRLAALGGSNGGLLVGAAITREPDLFGAAVSAVPLLDMLRFHRFLLGEAWTNEYGSPEDPEAVEWLLEYSPYHDVESRPYPATLFRTAAGDTRVHPSHARKMAALLQEMSTSEEPVLLRTITETGHGVGTPTSVQVRKSLDQWTFLYDQLGLDPGEAED
ncbi:S9 family peptidase [Halobacteriales archaeon QS_8_69_26]|nr:MAG: S9 family peptidase [Halobacteriales archaeon QS_8_69_26]